MRDGPDDRILATITVGIGRSPQLSALTKGLNRWAKDRV